MSSIWDALGRKFRSALIWVCPFCTNDYQYASPNRRPSDEPDSELKKDVYTPKKDRKHVRKKEQEDDYIVVKADEEAGFSSKSSESNSQCFDVEVQNSDELNRIMIRKSQFLPPEPYQPSAEEIAAEELPKDATLAKTIPKSVTLKKGVQSPAPLTPNKPVSPVQPPISPSRYSPTSPDDFADSISQVSKKSKKSLFGFGKKKKQKKDPDSQSVFSFASFKSGKSVESKSEALERKERKRREKEEKKDKKEVEKQELKLSHGLNQQKFENIYPWMNELEPFDDEIEVPNVIEEIRIREAQELNRLDKEEMYEDRSYAAESFLDLGTQLMPVSQISEPVAPVQINKFGAPKEGFKKPFAPSLSPLVREAEKPKGPRTRQTSSDAETEGIVRKARKSLAAVEPSVSIEAPAPGDSVTPLKKKDIFQNAPLKKKDIFANVLPPQREPDHKDAVDEQHQRVIETKSDNEDFIVNRDLKKEIQEVTQGEDFLQTISVDISEHRSRREKKKRARAEKSEKSRKKKRSPTRIESNPIEDRSIDDIPVEKDLLADLTNPVLFPEPPQPNKKEIPIVNYTRNLDEDIKKKDDGDKVESIKEIQNTLDRRKKQLSEKSDKEVKVNNKELKNETTRMVVDEELAKNRMSYFDLDDGVLDHMNFRGVESERELLIQHGAPSGSRIPGQLPASESSQGKRRRKRDRSERSERRRRKDESETEREERKKRRREGAAERRRTRNEDSGDTEPQRMPRATSDNEDTPARKRRTRKDGSSDVKSEADAYRPRERRHRNRRHSGADQESRGDRESRRDRHSKRDSRKDRNLESSDIKEERKRDRSRDDSKRDRRRERSYDDRRKSLKVEVKGNVIITSREDKTFSDDKPPIPARKEVKELASPRKGSPVEVYEKDGALRAFPSHIARDIKSDIVEKRRKEFEEKKKLEIIRQKMDLDFQSVDTKRSVFISNDPAPVSPTPTSATSSKHKSGKKGKKKSRDSDLPPKPKPKRVSSRPKLDPIRSQEEAVKARHRPQRVIYESDEDKSGSTLHSGDEKPRVVKRQSSFTSNDSTLKDVGDIPSEWNVSMMSRSRQFSAKSTDSRDSRLTHRSQLSSARRSRGPSPAILEEKMPISDKKKKKRKSIF
ncbi:hypothetical protein ACHWQZ_G016204 [Mnemiopsis leidyi]